MQKDKSIYLVVTAFFPSVESFRGPYVYDQVKAIMKDGRYQVVASAAWTDLTYDASNVGNSWSFTDQSIDLSGYFATLAEERGVKEIYLSLSHTKELAMAQVVLEG